MREPKKGSSRSRLMRAFWSRAKCSVIIRGQRDNFGLARARPARTEVSGGRREACPTLCHGLGVANGPVDVGAGVLDGGGDARGVADAADLEFFGETFEVAEDALGVGGGGLAGEAGDDGIHGGGLGGG